MTYSFPIICCICRGEDTYLSYYKYVLHHCVSSCCQALVCYNCCGSRGKCIACSTNNAFVCEIKKTDWIKRFKMYQEWNQLCTANKFMLLFTGTKQFGSWRNVVEIACRTKWYEHPRYQELFRCYHRFVGDFYSSQMLFYTLSSAPVGKLYFIDLKPSPAMKQFFSNVADMAKFSRFSRKTVLNRYLFGLITLLFKRMIGEATPIQAYFVRKILKYCLAKKASKKLPF